MQIDKNAAIAYFNISEPEYNELLLEFTSQARKKISAIREAVAAGSPGNAATIAHSLKGIAASMKLDHCATLAKEIETVLKKGNTNLPEKLITDLLLAVSEVQEAGTRVQGSGKATP